MRRQKITLELVTPDDSMAPSNYDWWGILENLDDVRMVKVVAAGPVEYVENPRECIDCGSSEIDGPDPEGFWDCIGCGAAWIPGVASPDRPA